jgi:hypothetical protein
VVSVVAAALSEELQAITTAAANTDITSTVFEKGKDNFIVLVFEFSVSCKSAKR